MLLEEGAVTGGWSAAPNMFPPNPPRSHEFVFIGFQTLDASEDRPARRAGIESWMEEVAC